MRGKWGREGNTEGKREKLRGKWWRKMCERRMGEDAEEKMRGMGETEGKWRERRIRIKGKIKEKEKC